MLHGNFVSDLLSQEGRGGREEECLRDSRLCWGGRDGGHADWRGGGQAEVQQISPAPGEGAGHPDLWRGLLTPLSPPCVHTLPVLYTNTITSREAFMLKIKFHLLNFPPAKSPLGWRIFHTFNFYFILTFYFSALRQLVSVQTAKIGKTKEVGSGLTQSSVKFCNVLPPRAISLKIKGLAFFPPFIGEWYCPS